MEGNSALPPALRDHLTRQVRQYETTFQSSNGRPMTDHDWMRFEERATAAASSKGGKGCGNKTHTSMPGKLALLAWQKLRAAGWKRTFNATAHHKRRNSLDPPILVAGRYKPPDLKSKFENSVIRQISKDSGNNNNHLTQSKKKQRRLKEIETEKIMAGIERNKFRRRSADLVKAVPDAAGIVINRQQKEQKENDDYSNSSRAPTDFIKPHQSKLAAAATVFGPAAQQCNSRKLVSGDDATAAASLNDSSVIKGQSSCCHQPPLQQTCQQEGSDLNFEQPDNNSKKSGGSSRLVNDAIDINFTSTDDCVKQTDTVTTTTLGLGSMISSPRRRQHLEDHLSSPDGAAVSESHPTNNCSSSVINNNNLTLSRPDIIPSLSASSGCGAVSNVALPTSMFNSSIPHFQSSAASINAPPPGCGEGWGMRVSNAFKNTSIWKSVEESAAVMTDEEPRVPAGNEKDATGGKNDMSEPNTAAAAGTLFQREKKEHQHLRHNSIGDDSQESNNRLCHVNDVDDNAGTGGDGASNSRVQYRTPQIDGSVCDVKRDRKGGGNKVPLSVSDNFVRMDLRRKG
eukprot:130578_1